MKSYYLAHKKVTTYNIYIEFPYQVFQELFSFYAL